ncbi:MAG: hypothetical protein ABL955_09465 [Elusimicrobiota bacterium]
MMGLWADGWFYISSAGLLVSGILFFFLLGQYRIASEAADITEGEQGADKEVSSPAVVRPVFIPEDSPPARIVSHSDKPEAKPKTEGEYAGPDRRKDASTSTGGISPAVVYLQNIKVELADLHKDLRSLAKRVDDELAAVSTRDEALIDRLGELTRAVEGMKALAAAPEAASPKKARKAEKAPEPQPEPEAVPEPVPVSLVLEPVPEPKTEPVPEPKIEAVHSPDETIRMELGALLAPPPARIEPEAAPAEQIQEQAPVSSEPPPEEKPRRGPVWPV